MTGGGSKEIMGRPALDPVELLVRETVQNAWDARLEGAIPHYTVDYRELTFQQRRCLLADVLVENAPGADLYAQLNEDPWVFEIVDWNTTGLGGPTRADATPSDGEPTDFIDFMLKMGAQRDTPLGGGSYGFGKTATYAMSACDTIVVWSRCRVQGRIEDRFMASALGSEFESGGISFTGRQWWGRVVDDQPEPLVGEDARRLGEAVFEHRFAADQTGTAILILAADRARMDENWSTAQAGERMQNAVLWHLWPKLLPERERPASMKLSIRITGSDIPLPDPTSHPVLEGFCTALQAVRDVQAGREFDDLNTEVEEIWLARPKLLAGHLAVHRWPAPPAWESDGTSPSVSSPTAHVALMRHQAELVVKYAEYSRLPGAMQWAGVFKPIADHDDAFTDAEPPSHDDWKPANVKRSDHRRIVNVSLKRIGENVPSAASGKVSEAAEAQGTAQLAGALADLAASTGSAPSANRASGRSPGRTTRRARPRPPEILQVQRQTLESGRIHYAVEVGSGGSSEPVRVQVEAHVASESGTPDDVPELIALRSSDDGSVIDGLIDLAPGASRWVVVEAPADLAIDARVSVVEP